MLLCCALVIPVYPSPSHLLFARLTPSTCSSRVTSALGNSHHKPQRSRQTESLCCASPVFCLTFLEPKKPQNIIHGLTYFCRNTSKMQPSDQGEDYPLLHAQTRWSLGRVNDVPPNELDAEQGKATGSWGSACSPHTPQPRNSAGRRSSPHASGRVVGTSPSGIITGSAHSTAPTSLLHTYPSTHPLLPPLSLASLIIRPLTFSVTHSVTHPFTCFSFISPFSYTTWASNTFNPLAHSNFTS